MLFVITITMISVYLSLVFGTMKKFEKNGILFGNSAKVLLFFLPFIIFLIHLKIAIEVIGKDYRGAIEILKMGTVHYPVAVGILIEIALEKYAYKKVFGESLNRIKKDPIELNAGTVNKQKTKLITIYEKATLNLVTT